jgi:spore germination protein KA
MHRKKNTDKQKVVDEKVGEINNKYKHLKFDHSLDKNIATIQELFVDVDTLLVRWVQNIHNKALRYCLVFSDGVVDTALINESLIRPLMNSTAVSNTFNLIEMLENQVVQINEAITTSDFQEIIKAITYGDTALFVEGCDQAVIFNTKGYLTRATIEPDNEKILSGPREGFTESIMSNLSFIRRRIRTNELKLKMFTLGKRTQTSIYVCYMNGIANKEIVDEVFRRLGKIDIDAVLDSNYISELIRDKRWALFRTTGYTERPDVVVAKMLEGRVAIFVDGTPVVITVPYLFIENFQSNEDYYLSFYYTSFSRLLRIAGFFLTIGVPGIYVAVVAFHHEMLPTPLLINLAIERQSVPLPAALEAFIMLIVFDILRETGIRMPSNVGQALSIVGALVIGQAAVSAKLVAAPMIIVVATTGITSLLVPKLNAPVIYLRLFVLLLSSIFGFFGFVLSTSCMLIHIFNLTSISIPQISLGGSFQYQGMKDQVLRAPWWQMRYRSRKMTQNLVRMSNKDGEGNA